MVTRTKWVERKFNFDFPVGWFPCIIERLRGTAIRLEEALATVPVEKLTARPEHGWSIQENVGHLISVEELHLGRLDDYDAGAEVLRPADMENTRTFEADYNARGLGTILAEFRRVRGDLLARLEAMGDDEAARTAHHPRLDTPMRVCDMALFAAEHDDYHVAVIRELIRKFS